MQPKSRLIALIGAALIAITLAAPTFAKDGDIIKTGSCSGTADWKLKGGFDNGRVDVEFEVDTNRIGREWRVKLTDNGDVFFFGHRTTKAPSGSFTVSLQTRNRTGSDRIVARAVNVNSGQVCQGVITL
jgi:hypothetical protein